MIRTQKLPKWRSGAGGAALLSLCLAATGCHSHFINASIDNHTGATIHLLEVDYPSASFGTQDLPNGARFHYRFKILGSGSTKLTWTDASEKDHASDGPPLAEGQEGQLEITIGPERAIWQTHLSK